MRNIFLENSYSKFGRETSRRPLSKKNENCPYLWINGLKFYRVCFYFMASSGLSKYIETNLQTTCFHLILSFLKKITRGLELVSSSHFPHDFWRKIFLLLYSSNWPNFIVWLTLLCEIFRNMCIAIVCKLGCDAMNCVVKLIFLIKLFFLHDQKVVTKT